METIVDLYTLELTVNNNTFPIYSKDADIILSDSIYSIYPKVTISFKDSSGIITESRLATLGLKFDFKLGFQDDILNLPFVVNSFQLADSDALPYLNGVLEIELVHSFLKNYKKDFYVYENMSPSDILEDIIKNEKFRKTIVEKTVSIQDEPYYNNNLTFEMFLDKIIFPNSLSSINQNDPYFCFIDVENCFHFETYSEMVKKSPVKTIKLTPKLDEIGVLEHILEFNPFSSRYENIKDYLKFNHAYILDDENLSINEDLKNIIDNRQTPMSIIEEENITYIVNEDFADETSIKQSEIRINNLKKEKNTLDRLFVTTLLDTSIGAGKVIKVESEYQDDNISSSFTGNYLIEATQHSWESETEKGFTRMILSRQKVSYPSDSTITKDLMK